MVSEYRAAMRAANNAMHRAQDMHETAWQRLIAYCKSGVASIDGPFHLGEQGYMRGYEIYEGKVFVIYLPSQRREEIKPEEVPWGSFSERSLLSVASEIQARS